MLFVFSVSFVILYYLFYPNYVSNSCKIGVLLWFNEIFPTLFIFTILSNIIMSSNILNEINDRYLYMLNYFLGVILGFPIGAKIANDLCERNLISSKNAITIAALSNNFSLPFIVCFCLKNNLHTKNPEIVLISLYLPSFIFLIIFLINNPLIKQKKTASRFKINIQIIDAGIINGFETLIKLCGYIILFSVIARIPDMIPNSEIAFVRYLFSFIEATNGINFICNTKISTDIKTILCTSVLSFGGLSSIIQTKAIVQKLMSIKKYILIKIILTMASTIICYLQLIYC